MPSVGPQLPPHILAKRKREEQQDVQAQKADDRPTHHEVIQTSQTYSPDEAGKRRRVLGPTLPPAPLDERPRRPAKTSGYDSSSSDDDGIGPALPPAPGQQGAHESEASRRMLAEEVAARERESRPQREEWMLAPPKQEDLSAKADPTKLKNRKFNTGKGSKAPTEKAGVSAIWTETPEEKRKRLEDQVMGVVTPSMDARGGKSSQELAEAEETARRIRDYNDKNRNRSLYNEHKKAVPREKEDDPSARAFDKEKDIGGGQKIGHAKRKELLSKAADFGSRFAGGSYL